MGLITIFDASEINEILSHYDLGALREFRGVAEGSSNTTYAVRTQLRRVILRVNEGERLPAETADELNFIVELRENGIPCAEVLLTKTGANHMNFRNKQICLFAFIEGQKASELPDYSPALLEDLGDTLARLLF